MVMVVVVGECLSGVRELAHLVQGLRVVHFVLVDLAEVLQQRLVRLGRVVELLRVVVAVRQQGQRRARAREVLHLLVQQLDGLVILLVLDPSVHRCGVLTLRDLHRRHRGLPFRNKTKQTLQPAATLVSTLSLSSLARSRSMLPMMTACRYYIGPAMLSL